jgi:hypothetical protein
VLAFVVNPSLLVFSVPEPLLVAVPDNVELSTVNVPFPQVAVPPRVPLIAVILVVSEPIVVLPVVPLTVVASVVPLTAVPPVVPVAVPVELPPAEPALANATAFA